MQILLFLAIVILQPIAILNAATQGVAGASSSGDAVIRMGIVAVDELRISGINDADFGIWNGNNNITRNDDVCVYSNSTLYQITATGDGPSGYQLVSAAGDTIDYQVRWNDVSGTNRGGSNLTSGVALTDQTGADQLSTNCSGGNNARIRIRILSSQFDANAPGLYTGTLTILVEPPA